VGGENGGCDFDPRGKTKHYGGRFCRAFMLELHRHIGLDTDVPAGDMGVGGREIGYLYGMYRQLTNRNEGVLTGKDELFGGSCGRTAATGHGVVYMAELAAQQAGLSLEGMTAVVSGAGNVAEHTARMLIQKGAVVQTLSERDGYLYKYTGFTTADFDTISACKACKGSLSSLSIDGAEYRPGAPWREVVADAYFPCATQNEVDEMSANAIVEHAKLMVEGANMPLTDAAAKVIRASHVVYVPGKAANAGGVAVSGLEMAQNAGHLPWECDRVESELQKIMQRIHAQCVEYGTDKETGAVDYVNGANLAGFARVFSAMEKLGW
jgi:glutamate dehydrogenase (NADP+)